MNWGKVITRHYFSIFFTLSLLSSLIFFSTIKRGISVPTLPSFFSLIIPTTQTNPTTIPSTLTFTHTNNQVLHPTTLKQEQETKMSSIQDKNNEHFNNKAHEYDNIPMAKEMTAKASETILAAYTASTSEEHVRNSTVLDFGCGTGLAAFLVAEKVAHLVGVDASSGMLEYLHKKLDTLPELASLKAANKIHTVNHLVTDASPLPEPELTKYLGGENGGFDMVFSNYVLHHIEDVQGVIDTLGKKIVKHGGWVIVLDFEGHHVHGGVDHGHEHHGHDHGHSHGHGHDHAAHAHGHDHGHDHGHGHGHHDHSHSHGHAHGDKKHEHEGLVKVDDIYKDEEGKPLEYVAHKGGFNPENMAEIFTKAGLVDVSATRSFGFFRDLRGTQVWTDVLIAKGRRP